MRTYRKKMIPVFIVPTGVGAEIGGHAGDANPALRLIASISDLVVTHPNVVNASDINEMPDNALYVEGSILDRFLEGDIELEPVHQNRILLVVNSPVHPDTINAASAARATLGADITMMELDTPLEMVATKESDGSASGTVKGVRQLVSQVNQYNYDALAIATPIKVSGPVALYYLENGGINPWGGVEAMVSRQIANEIDKPTAHAPVVLAGNVLEKYREVVDPRVAAEMVSVSYLHCVLKGLHTAPRIGKGLSVRDVSCLITPIGCVGNPHWAAQKHRIPIIVVRENKTCLNDKLESGYPNRVIYVNNYLEAAGVLACMRDGILPSAVRRPLKRTEILRNDTTTR